MMAFQDVNPFVRISLNDIRLIYKKELVNLFGVLEIILNNGKSYYLVMESRFVAE